MFETPLPTVTPAEAAARTAEGWQLLDVRTDEEWADGHVAGAVHIPMDQVVARVEEIEDRAVVMCAAGGRSARVTQWLLGQGRDVVNLDGGIHAWEDEGRAIER